MRRILQIFSALFLVACDDGSQEPTETTTRGEVNVVIDESFRQLFDNQIYTFESIYPNAKINAEFLPENQALSKLLKDSCKVVVMCRNITERELKQFEGENLFPISTKIAEDAIAFIVNNQNGNTKLTVQTIKSILLGNDSIWSQINADSPSEIIQVVFDHKGSANTNYMKDSILKGLPFSKNAFALQSNTEVIDYVSNAKNAIGVISVNWISDLDDPLTKEILKKVMVVAVGKTAIENAVKPYQAYIKPKEYPFTRDVYMINRQTRAGLGMGFVSFVAGVKGQLMILKSGLIPAIAPVRIVEIKMK